MIGGQLQELPLLLLLLELEGLLLELLRLLADEELEDGGGQGA